MGGAWRSVRRAASSTADRVRQVVSSKQWEHREQLHTLSESNVFFLRKIRWQISLLGMMGFMISFAIRCNFAVSKTRMVSNFTDAYGEVHEAKFKWSPTELGILESSFFYGYAASQVPAGLLAAKFAPNHLLLWGVLIASLTNISTGFALAYHPFTDYAVMVMQVVQGLALGVIYPAMHGVWRHWAPPLERSKLATTTFTGSYCGVMVGLPLSAALVSYVHWEAPFHFFGVMGIFWCLVWYVLTSRTPADNRFISSEERTFITEKVGHVATGNMTLTTVPWRSILLSLPNWSIIVCNFCRNWTFYLLMSNQLTYMKDVLHMDIRNSGMFSALPQILMAVTVLSSGQLADHLRGTGKMSTGNVRKLFNTLGFGGEAICLALLSQVKDPIAAITILIFGVGVSGICIAGFNVNHFDIAPRYAPILMGFSNGIGALAGMNTIVTEHLTHGNPDGWQWCFIIAMCVDLFGIVFYLLFGEGEIQEWAREPEPEETMGEFVRRISSMVRSVSLRSRKNHSVKTLTSFGAVTEVPHEDVNPSAAEHALRASTRSAVSEKSSSSNGSGDSTTSECAELAQFSTPTASEIRGASKEVSIKPPTAVSLGGGVVREKGTPDRPEV